MAAIAHQPHLWTRDEYERLIETGGLHPEARLELIDGEILDMAVQKSRHSTAVQLVNDALIDVFATGFTVRPQLPLAMDDYSEPRIGSNRCMRTARPSTSLTYCPDDQVSVALSSSSQDCAVRGHSSRHCHTFLTI